MQLSAQWPFDVRKTPFFYGWVIFALSTVGFLLSVPGQTMGMAVFTDHFIVALGLTRTELSMAYLVGTVASAFFLTRAGRWYDRFGGRIMLVGSSLALGLMVFYISLTDKVADLLGGSTVVAFCVILLGYFGVRFFGQGILTSASRNVMLLWFVKRRGLVSGIRGIFVSLGFSIAPLVLAGLIFLVEWRQALWIMAVIVGVVFTVVSLIFARDSPESCGLLADGETLDGEQTRPVLIESLTLREARASPVFWIYSMSLAMHALFGTALTFHVVSIFAESSRSAEEAFGYFLPAAVFSTTMNLVASWMVDSMPLKPFLVTMLMGFLLGAWGLLHLDQDWGFWLLAFGFGTGGGLWGVISNLVFIRFYGPLHLGEISGFNTSLTVFASAIGPAAFSLGQDFLGGYNSAVSVCMIGLTILTILAIVINQHELEPERMTSRKQAGND